MPGRASTRSSKESVSRSFGVLSNRRQESALDFHVPGQATWYDPPWSGLTAAHPWLPFGTQVLVTDLASGRSVTVTIDDRGPFAPGRIIDLSPEAFAALQPLGAGVLDVTIAW